MLKGTKHHMRDLPDLPRYVLVIPITCATSALRMPYLLREFKRAFPIRYTSFYAKFSEHLCPYRWFDVWRADPYEFAPHIVTAAVRRTGMEKLNPTVVEDVLYGISEWMKIELPMVKDMFIAMPPVMADCQKIKSVAENLFGNRHDINAFMFARPLVKGR